MYFGPLLIRNSTQTLGWGSKLIKSDKVCLGSLPNSNFLLSSDKNVSLPPGTGMVLLTWEFYFLLSGEKSVVSVLTLAVT